MSVEAVAQPARHKDVSRSRDGRPDPARARRRRYGRTPWTRTVSPHIALTAAACALHRGTIVCTYKPIRRAIILDDEFVAGRVTPTLRRRQRCAPPEIHRLHRRLPARSSSRFVSRLHRRRRGGDRRADRRRPRSHRRLQRESLDACQLIVDSDLAPRPETAIARGYSEARRGRLASRSGFPPCRSWRRR